MSSSVEGHIRICPLGELKWRRYKITKSGDYDIVVFFHNGELYAVQNFCSHSGYALHTGTVEEGIVTCMWHQARFELSSGECFDPELADDIATFAVTVVDGDVWVNPQPDQKS